MPNYNHSHGHTTNGKRSAEYACWTSIKDRCLNPNSGRYSRYGGRGIIVCDRWRSSFENFLADMGPRPGPQYSIDRINNDGPYAPGNCRWATRQQQDANRDLAAMRGEARPLAKLTEAQVREIRRDCRSQRGIAATYGVSQGVIGDIKLGRSWSHVR